MTSPHDAFAKFSFGDVRRAAEELAAVVGPAQAALVDWSTLQADPTELMDEALERSFPDLRWSARMMDGEVRLGLLFEHQSTMDPSIAVRFFCHTGAIWNEARKEGRAGVPLVLNVVLHNGPRPWTRPPGLWTAIEGGSYFLETVPHWLPHLPVLIDDLAAVTDGQIHARRQSPEVTLALLALKHTATDDAVPMLAREAALVAAASEDVLRKTVGYVLEADGSASVASVAAAVRGSLGTKGEEVVMTVGQQLIEQGKKVGEAKGRAEGRTEGRGEGLKLSLRRILERRGFRMTDSQSQQIEACRDDAQLLDWTDSAVTATSIDDLFRSPAKH